MRRKTLSTRGVLIAPAPVAHHSSKDTDLPVELEGGVTRRRYYTVHDEAVARRFDLTGKCSAASDAIVVARNSATACFSISFTFRLREHPPCRGQTDDRKTQRVNSVPP